MPHAITYSFTSTSFRDNVIVDENEDVQYWIETERSGFLNRPKDTHLYKPSHKSFGTRELVATIDFRSSASSPGNVTIAGTTTSIKELFPKKAWYSAKRTMPTAFGDFHWSRKGELVDESGNTVVLFKTNRHVFKKSSPPTIIISGHALPLKMDMIILGWMVMMHDQEQARKSQQRATTNGAIASNAAAASAGGGGGGGGAC